MSRCRWICACICDAHSGVQAHVAAVIEALAKKAESAGTAVMQSYTPSSRDARARLAFFSVACAALRRDFDASRGVAGSRCDAARIGRRCGHQIRDGYGHARVASRIFARRGQRSTPLRSRLVALPARVRDADGTGAASRKTFIFCDEEHGFFQLSDASSTGSSMMPQKKNPDPLELIRGKSGRLIGHLTGWMATMKGLPSGYNKDLQEDKEAVFDAQDNVAGALLTLVGVIDGLEIFPKVMAAAASACCSPPTSLIFSVGKGMPFRDAHEVVGGWCASCSPSGATSAR